MVKIILILLLIGITYQATVNCSVLNSSYSVDPTAENIHFKIKVTSQFSTSSFYQPYTWVSNVTLPELNCTIAYTDNKLL